MDQFLVNSKSNRSVLFRIQKIKKKHVEDLIVISNKLIPQVQTQLGPPKLAELKVQEGTKDIRIPSK